MRVAGVDWVCEVVTDTQCKPLYPKVTTRMCFFTSSEKVIDLCNRCNLSFNDDGKSNEIFYRMKIFVSFQQKVSIV